MNKFHTTSFILGIVLGALLTGAWFLGDIFHLPAYQSTPLPLSTATTTPIANNTGGAVAVSDQSAGETVVVDSITVPPPGVWVAVRESGGDDDLGNVLGAIRVRGPLSNISIPLLRPTVPGKVYAVELYRDDGDGNFDPSIDSVYVDFDTGARVVALFTTK